MYISIFKYFTAVGTFGAMTLVDQSEAQNTGDPPSILTDSRHPRATDLEPDGGPDDLQDDGGASCPVKDRANTEESIQPTADFLATISHDLRVHVSSIISLTGFLLEGELPPEQREYAEAIESSADALLIMVNDILDLSRAQGMTEAESALFSLRSAVEKAMDIVAPKAAAKGLNMAYTSIGETPGIICGDPFKIHRVLVNLLDNAVKFTEEGDVVVSTLVTRLKGSALNVHFSVMDTGIGIPPERLDKLFLPFSKADSYVSKYHGGTGLGLAISKRLVELMGGRIWVRSTPGQGSIFHFSICAMESMGKEKHQVIETPELSGFKLLFIGRNKTTGKVVLSLARPWGLVTKITPDVQTALKAIRGGEYFDMVLVDLSEGEEVTEEIQKEVRAPVIALTTMGYQPQKAKFSSVLTKPLKAHRLRDALVKIINGNLIEAHPLKILLADDNQVSRKIAIHMLSRLGYSTDVATKGSEVLRAFEYQLYDLILMDIQMPDIDGLNVTRSIRERWASEDQPYIVAMTGYTEKEDKKRCLNAGMDDHLSKPIRIEDLSRVLRQAGSRKRAS